MPDKNINRTLPIKYNKKFENTSKCKRSWSREGPEWRIQVNTDKNRVVLFRPRIDAHNHRQLVNNVTIGMSELPWSSEGTYLGIVLDKGLNFVAPLP